MNREEIKARGASRAKAVVDLLQALTKEELLELICGNWHYLYQISERNICDAKARVLRKKASAAFQKYEELSELCRQMPHETLNQLIAKGQKHDEARVFLNKWNRLWNRADLFEFGPKKENEHAAKQS